MVEPVPANRVDDVAVPEVRIQIKNVHELKADRLLAIRKDERLDFLLKDWEKQFKVARERIETKTTRTNNAKSDLYQWIGFFSVFQGVVLTAVAQSSTLGCRQSWAPASLSLIASLVTAVSVRFKLKSYRELEVNLADEISHSTILHDQIAQLKADGIDFNFSWFPDVRPGYDPDAKKEKKKKKEKRNNLYDWAVMISLVVFSTIILLCCILVLCGPDKHVSGT